VYERHTTRCDEPQRNRRGRKRIEIVEGWLKTLDHQGTKEAVGAGWAKG